jgi:hypothetical protein
MEQFVTDCRAVFAQIRPTKQFAKWWRARYLILRLF